MADPSASHSLTDSARERDRWQRAGSKLLTNLCNFVAAPADSSAAPYRRLGAEAALVALVAAHAKGDTVGSGSDDGSGRINGGVATLTSSASSASAAASVFGPSPPSSPASCLAAFPLLRSRLADLVGDQSDARRGVCGLQGGPNLDESHIVSALRILAVLVQPLATGAGAAGTVAGCPDDRAQLVAWSRVVFEFAVQGTAAGSREKAAQVFALISRYCDTDEVLQPVRVL